MSESINGWRYVDALTADCGGGVGGGAVGIALAGLVLQVFTRCSRRYRSVD